MTSQGILNGRITKCSGDFNCFERVVQSFPHEMRVKGYRHFLMWKRLKVKK